MTGTALELRETPTAIMLSERQLNFIAKTEFVPKAFRGNLPAIMACVATGRALGLPDMTALRSINIIDGKATFSAELMVQLVRSHGHSIQGEVSGDRALVRGKRADNSDEMTCEWTLDMAKRAGLLSKQNWVKYPEAMLWARAVSQLCRMLFADCFAGATYTPEEGEFTADEVMDDEGSVEEPQADVTPAAEPIGSTVSEAPADAGEPPSSPALSDAQKTKLNVLVGTLREQGHITTEQLWTVLRPEQSDRWPGDWPRDDDGVLHWSPLRDVLTRDEASSLIDRLERFAETVAAAQGEATA